MKFNDKAKKQERKKSRRLVVGTIVDNILIKPLDNIRDCIDENAKQRDLKSMEKLKERALAELIKDVEKELLNLKTGTRVYKDAYFDNSTLSIKREIVGPFSRLNLCRRYGYLLDESKEELDLDYFYYGIFRHFQKYDDLILEEKIDHTWEMHSNWARDLEYIEIEKI